MSWGAVAGAAVGVVGSALTSDKKGGAGTQTSTSEPWANAVPWLVHNLNTGLGLQHQYSQTPISAQQRRALDNSYGLSDAVRAGVPSLLAQFSGQPMGYDPKNPSARPQAFDYSSLLSSLANGGGSARQAPPPAPAPAPAPVASNFTDQANTLTGENVIGIDPTTGEPMFGGSGGYGEWRYGSTPKAGSQAYRDMSEYFLRGGADPNGMYSSLLGRAPAAAPLPQLLQGY